MDYLQYLRFKRIWWSSPTCFKPYYKWITFNTFEVLSQTCVMPLGFKPYYKWITFNT